MLKKLKKLPWKTIAKVGAGIAAGVGLGQVEAVVDIVDVALGR